MKKRFLFGLLIAGFLIPLLSCNFSFKEKADSETSDSKKPDTEKPGQEEPGQEEPGLEEPDSWSTVQPLYEIYQDYFLLGNIVSPGDLTNVRFDILKRHFNTATAENAMKPEAIAPSPQPVSGDWAYRWTQADSVVNAVNAAGMHMHGHTLIWHQQTPYWLASKDDQTPLDKETVLANLEKFVTDVTTHFKGRVISWDVVNEAMRDGLTAANAAGDWRDCLRKNDLPGQPGTGSAWNRNIGSEYIEQAFLAARAADPDAKLFYNDYNLNSNTGNYKQQAVYNMVKDINERHPDVGGRPLIDGIGMQSHHHLKTTPESVKASIELFAKLNVEIAVSEMDIMAAKAYNNGLTNSWDDKAAQDQAALYAAMFKIFKEYSSNISRVTFWGLDDGTSWRKDSCPTLLDKDYNLKPAFYAVANPDDF